MPIPAPLIPSNTVPTVILWLSAAATPSSHYGTLLTGSANTLYRTWLAVSIAYLSVSTAHTSAVLTVWIKMAIRASMSHVLKLARLCILSRPRTSSTFSHGIHSGIGSHMLVILVVSRSSASVAIFDPLPKSFLSRVPRIWFSGLARRCLECSYEIDTSSSLLHCFIVPLPFLLLWYAQLHTRQSRGQRVTLR
jgi:hypothetical protein